MPFTYLAHQIVVLPLKNIRPRWFSATALIIGSVVPDLEYLRDSSHLPTRLGHSLKGQFTYCLPITLATVVVLTELVIRPLAKRFPKNRLHLDELELVAAPIRSMRDAARVTLSALIGSFSHVILDGFTHAHMWPARAWYASVSLQLFDHPILLPLFFQYMFSAVGAFWALFWGVRQIRTDVFRRWSGRDAETGERKRGAWLLLVMALLGFVLSTFGTRPWLAPPRALFYARQVLRMGFSRLPIDLSGVSWGNSGATLLGLYDRIDAWYAAKKSRNNAVQSSAPSSTPNAP
ncbi:MAG: DUF4184 family protein [Polyangiaceae bacterium]